MLPSLVLGLIQGLTEFLPVSSSGHLVLAHSLFGYKELDPAYDVFIQGGTILSLLVYYAPRLAKLKLTKTYIFKLIIGITPSAIIGLLLRHKIDILFASTSYLWIGFLATSILLFCTYKRRGHNELTWGKVIIIALFQAASILRSLSRSGATIGSALLLGISPTVAFDFSFLMSIPLVAGASILSLDSLTFAPELLISYIAGLLVAAVVGYVTLIVLGKLVKNGKLYVFAPYTLLLALISYFFT